MKPAPFNLLLETASRDNILILTTACSTSCVFCSHLQNPEEVLAYYVNKLSREQIDTLIEFLDGSKKIVIGESATRICEGEPFLCSDIIPILQQIRHKYPDAPIQVTTSGIHLDRAVLSRLQNVGGLELNISLNSSTLEGRRKLYRGREHLTAVEAIRLLKAYGIAYTGSIVAMPHLVGWEDIRDTILFLQENGASAVRLFMPGYTRFTKGLLPPGDIRGSLKHFAEELGVQLSIPLLLEPSGVRDTLALVEGVVSGSPAWRSGMQKGDRILKVNGKQALSRVDAYYSLHKAKNPCVEYERNGRILTAVIEKQPELSAGMVFNYDIHPDTILEIKRVIRRSKGRRCLILTSELAYHILADCIPIAAETELQAVRNEFFGGNILCAGLLTLSDIEAHLGRRKELPQVLLLPGIMFDSAGRDLLGRHYMELEEGLGIKVEVLS